MDELEGKLVTVKPGLNRIGGRYSDDEIAVLFLALRDGIRGAKTKELADKIESNVQPTLLIEEKGE